MARVREKKQPKPIIKITDLKKEFKTPRQTIPVLKGFDTEILYGDFAIIYGPSGCGKSTFLNILLGIEEPSEGSVNVIGEDIAAKNDAELTKFRRQNFGIVFQQPTWVRSLSVIENVGLPLNIAGVSKNKVTARAKDMLEMMGLHELADQNPTDLSGGEQQRVSVARSLITNPRILVADEPTGNLDYESGVQLMDRFDYLNKTANRTVILVTHNLEYQHYATRLLFMKDGVIEKTTLQEKTDIVFEEQTNKEDAEPAGKQGD